MWRDELPWGMTEATETDEELAVAIEDADAWAEVGPIPVDLQGGAILADIEATTAAIGEAEAVGAVHIVPLCLVLAVAVEDLDPMIFPIGHINIAPGITDDVVNDIELAGAATGQPHDIRCRPSGEYLCTRALP